LKSKVFEILYHNRDAYISGETISKSLSISRAAVWKHINSLKEDGAEIESVNNRGYRMRGLPSPLKSEYVLPLLEKRYGETRMIWCESVDSTNTYAKSMAQNISGEMVVVSERQTQGKGRLGRIWQSPPGGNLYVSFVLRPKISPQQAAGITLIAALAVCDAIKQTCGVQAGIKWPNDIILNGRKVCGILTEMVSDMDSIEFLVIGIGINVNGMDWPEDLKDKAVSLQEATGKVIDRHELIANLIPTVFDRARQLETFGVKQFINEYTALSVIFDKKISIIIREKQWIGSCVGFNENGELLFQPDGGEPMVLNAGEISVRGVNGYV